MLPIWRDRMVKIMKSTKLSLRDFCKAIDSAAKCDDLAKLNEQTYGTAAR
jgi:hypothetical protein